MKPLQLIMSAFGPYKDETLIEFESLGNSGIFLITGDTGAGKTTIFDAISFALYGVVSGSNKEIDSLRSNFSNDDVKTYVKLKFFHKGKEYIVTREPAYVKPKKNGSGTTKNIASASLEYDDKIIAKVNEVTSKIEEILGITAKQFKQISMLAQGEFIKVLFADSKERIEIFRRIFETDIFDRITMKLGFLASENRKKLEDLKTEFFTNLNNIIWKDKPAIALTLDSKNVNEPVIQEILELLEKEVDTNREEYKNVEDELKKIEKEYKKIEDEIKVQQEFNNKIELYCKLIGEKDNLISKEKEIEELNEFLNKNDKIIATVKPKEEKYNFTVKEIEKINAGLKRVIELIQIGEEKEKQNQSREEKAKELKIFAETYKEELENKINLEQKINKIKMIEQISSQKDKFEIEYKKVQKEFNEIENKYKEEDEKFFIEQAGILADKLEEGKPCPVCGSKEHPHKAKKSDEVLTKVELDKLKGQVEKELKKRDKIRNDIIAIKSRFDTLIQEFIEKSDEEIDLVRYKNELSNNYKDLVQKINLLKLNFDKEINEISKKKYNIEKFNFDEFYEEFSKQLKEEANELIKQKTNKEIYEKQLKEKNKELQKNQKDYEKSYQSLGFESELDYKANILSSVEIKNKKRQIEKYKENVTANKVQIKNIEKDVKGKEIVDLSEKIEKMNGLSEEIKNQKRLQQSLHLIYESNTRMNRFLKQTSKDLILQIQRMGVVEDLAKTANGSLSGKRKIKFEEYVQATYFDMVIFEANKRLVNMTDNRYLLIRKESSEKISDKIGLDLEVIDNYNGKKRDVKSLSGGEAFKAALSLALGLSDVIQTYSGGVVVDTLFIDEGFGTLDVESREQAINTLLQLAGNNKLIGIISHVSELKERIDKKIVVTKSQNGSRIEIVV